MTASTMGARVFNLHRRFSRPELEKFTSLIRPHNSGDRYMIFQFKVSWGSKNTRNCSPLKPQKTIGKRVVKISSPKSADSSPIYPIRVPKRTTTEKLSTDEEMAVSGLLMMANQNTWKITKNLKDSDLNLQSRLLIGKAQIREQIIPFLDEQSVREIHSSDGLKVRVMDFDTDEVYELKLKWWNSSTSYVFVSGWRQNFVGRRELKKDDEIGLYWDRFDQMLVFSVIQRAKRVFIDVS